MLDVLLLLVAAFLAGGLNALAGGGSFLVFPALVFVGVPPVVANATGTVSQLPGYVASVWGFRRELEAPPGLSLWAVVILSLLGGSLGAALLLLTPDAAFRKLVPWLLLVATAMFACAPQLRAWVSGGNHAHASSRSAGAGMLLVSGYGGYFNGGLGILLLALFGLLGQTRLNAMNGLKALVSALLTAIATAIYAMGGVVQWREALLMMVATTLGGYAGARMARRLPAAVLRWGVVLTGLVMAGVFFWKE